MNGETAGFPQADKKAPRHNVGRLIEDLMKVKGIGIQFDLHGKDNFNPGLGGLSSWCKLLFVDEIGRIPVKSFFLRPHEQSAS